MGKKILVARLEIQKGKESDFLSIVPGLIKASNAESGCLCYTLYQNPFNASEFIFYEEYQNDEAVKFHGNTAHFQSFIKSVAPLLAKELDLQTF